MKLRDFVNLKKNKRNNQISLDIKKRKLKEIDLDVKKILDIEINYPKKLEKFKRGI